MSTKGKKIAQFKLAIEITDAVIKAEIKARKLPSIAAECLRIVTKAQSISLSNQLAATPHQYFNAQGKIDKRKMRRHDRKAGIKTHTSRIVRVKS